MTSDTAYFVLAYLHGYSVNDSWKDWAYRNYISGHELDSLMELIHLDKRPNQFEAREIVRRVFADLAIDATHTNFWIKKYVKYLFVEIKARRVELPVALQRLSQMYVDSIHELDQLKVFYLIFNGWIDIEEIGMQWYYDGMTKENRCEIALEAFTMFDND